MKKRLDWAMEQNLRTKVELLENKGLQSHMETRSKFTWLMQSLPYIGCDHMDIHRQTG